MKLEWSAGALADLDRFAVFLEEKHPELASRIARSILEKARVLSNHPQLGRTIEGHEEFRQLVVHALGAAYVLQYRVMDDRIIVLRAFHGREAR